MAASGKRPAAASQPKIVRRRRLHTGGWRLFELTQVAPFFNVSCSRQASQVTTSMWSTAVSDAALTATCVLAAQRFRDAQQPTAVCGG